MARDYRTEMRKLVDEATSHGPYVSSMVAADIVARLAVEDPELLNGWLVMSAAHFLHLEINRRDMAYRAGVRATAGSRSFRAATDAAEAGDPEPLKKFRFSDMPVVVEKDLRVRLAEMTAEELRFAASHYRGIAERNALQATFLSVLSRKVGTKRVQDVYNEEQLSTLWQSLTKTKQPT